MDDVPALEACELGSSCHLAALIGGQGLGPLALKLFKEVLVGEGPAVDDGIEDEVEHCHHAADEKEGQEGLEVLPELLSPGTHESRGQGDALAPLLGSPAEAPWSDSSGGAAQHRERETQGWWHRKPESASAEAGRQESKRKGGESQLKGVARNK